MAPCRKKHKYMHEMDQVFANKNINAYGETFLNEMTDKNNIEYVKLCDYAPPKESKLDKTGSRDDDPYKLLAEANIIDERMHEQAVADDNESDSDQIDETDDDDDDVVDTEDEADNSLFASNRFNEYFVFRQRREAARERRHKELLACIHKYLDRKEEEQQ